MEPPQKKQKLSAEQSKLPLLTELRLEILEYLLPDQPIRLRWKIPTMKSALLKISETVAPDFSGYASVNDTFAGEAVMTLLGLCTVEFKFDKGELHGFGLVWNAGCDIKKAAEEDLKGIKEIELSLPRLERDHQRMAVAPFLANGSTEYEADIAHFVQILSNLASLQKLTVRVGMAGPYIALLSSPKPQHRHVFEHFTEMLEPFRALRQCEIDIETRQTNDPRFDLQARCPEAFDHLQDLIQELNS